MKFHRNRLGFLHQSAFHQKGVSINVMNRVIIFLLIQSKGQAWPASACGHVHPDGGYFLTSKVHIKLFFGSFG